MSEVLQAVYDFNSTTARLSQLFDDDRHTFGVRGSISWEYIGVLEFCDVVQADAESHVIDHLMQAQHYTI